MRKKIGRLINCIMVICLTILALSPLQEQVLPVSASSISQVQSNIDQYNREVKALREKIDSLSEEQDLVEEKIQDLSAEIVNTMTSIGVKQDEIEEKERQLELKQDDIDLTEQEYEAAKVREAEQYDAMIARARLMYESDESTYLALILEGNGLRDILNRLDFVEKVYEYDRTKLEEYETTKQQVLDLWNQLEQEKLQLENDKEQLLTDQQNLEHQKDYLDGLLAKRKQESANFEAEIAKARQDAAVAKSLLQQEEQRLRQLQAAQRNTSNAAATSGNYTTTDYTSVIDGASGSDGGKNVAKYACQFIGNPYVSGGTSLTNGADCSGFTYRVYKDFGYTLPRTSYEQRSAGSGVSYDEAQPGDLICYDGHVALYIGGGMIVHASTARTGIKISNANYRPILAVRRIL